MSETQLTKPLYKPQPPAHDPDAPAGPPPRGPQPSIVTRAAATLADLLLLHFFCLLLIKLFPDAIASLGTFGRILAVIFAILYLGLGTSRMFLGRTLGKLLTRVQVLDLDQKELPPVKSLQRAALLLWPLLGTALVNPLLDNYDHTEKFSFTVVLFYMTNAVAIAWFAANFFHIAIHPHKRSIVDLLAGGILVNTDGEPEQTHEWIAAARESTIASAFHRNAAYCALVAAIFVLGLGGMLAFQAREMIGTQPLGVVQAQAFKNKLRHDTFGIPSFVPSSNIALVRDLFNDGDGTTWSLPVTVQYQIRDRVAPNGPVAEEVTSTGLAKLEQLVLEPESQDILRQQIEGVAYERMRKKSATTSEPATLYLEVSVAETADLLFSRDNVPVKSRAKMIDLATSQTVEVPE